jgi:hypothetical protein
MMSESLYIVLRLVFLFKNNVFDTELCLSEDRGRVNYPKSLF